ncbi:hypothetical protein SMICM17S_10966 [Streptomyces microflavus]
MRNAAARRYTGGLGAEPRIQGARASRTHGKNSAPMTPPVRTAPSSQAARMPAAHASSVRRARRAWARTRAASKPVDGATTHCSWTYSWSMTASR